MGFCTEIRLKIKVLLRQYDQFVEENVGMALEVTTALKGILSNPLTQVLTAIIPSDIDEVIRVRLVDALGKAIDVLNVVNACKGETTIEGKVLCFVDAVKKFNPAMQDALLHKLASLLARELDGNTKAQHIYDLFVQAKFSSAK